MASIEWVDSSGFASLSNLKPPPADRFSDWTPDIDTVGPEAVPPGTGRIFRYPFRDDDIVSFQLRGIPGSEMSLMRRVKLHLINGGVVSLVTGDILAETYATCSLLPGTKPEIRLTDRARGLYTVSLTLRAVAPSDSDVISPVLPSLVWWGRAASLLGIVPDGATSDTLPDESGNNYDGVQATAGKRATFREDAEGGYPALEFDFANSDHYLTPSIINPGLGSTLIAVLRRWGTPVEHGNYMGFADGTGENGSGTRLYSRDSGGSNELRWATGPSGPYTLGTGVNTRFLIGLKITSSSVVTPYFNSLTAGTPFDPDNTVSAGVKRLVIGRDNVVSGNTGNNQFFEGLLYDDDLNTTYFERAMRYAAAANGITLV